MRRALIKGLWWLPDRPTEQVSGELTFEAEKHPVLSLLGSFAAIE